MLSRFLRIPTTEKTSHSCDDAAKQFKFIRDIEYIVNFFKCVKSLSLAFSSFVKTVIFWDVESKDKIRLEFQVLYTYMLGAILNYELITNKYRE